MRTPWLPHLFDNRKNHIELEVSLSGSYSLEASNFRFTFDVESLFTNLTLEMCIELAIDYISEGNPDLNGSSYDQIDAVAVGFPLVSERSEIPSSPLRPASASIQ